MSWILTSTGKVFEYLHTTEDQIDINDIAFGLSRESRFAGQTSHFYSVAQHSLAVARAVPLDYALEGLLHDAAEAYCKDLPSPLKALLPGYKEIELRACRNASSKPI